MAKVYRYFENGECLLSTHDVFEWQKYNIKHVKGAFASTADSYGYRVWQYNGYAWVGSNKSHMLAEGYSAQQLFTPATHEVSGTVTLRSAFKTKQSEEELDTVL